MKIPKSSLMKIIPIVLVLIAFIGLFTLFKSPEPIKLPEGYVPPQAGSIERIEDVPGVTDVKRISDFKKTSTLGTMNNSKNVTSRYPIPTPIPYPRMAINYSIKTTSSIRDENSGPNSTFIIVTLDIRNYGYLYFDAHPTKFKIVGRDIRLNRDIDLMPIVNISTGNMLEEVITNNSRAKGDLIFLIDRRTFRFAPKIVYLDNNYLIFYRQVSQSVMEGKEEKSKPRYED